MDSICLINSKVEGLLKSQPLLFLSGSVQIHEKMENLFARAVVKEEKLLGNITGMFSFGNKSNKPLPELNEINLLIFKRVNGKKMPFCEGKLSYKRKLCSLYSNFK